MAGVRTRGAQSAASTCSLHHRPHIPGRLECGYHFSVHRAPDSGGQRRPPSAHCPLCVANRSHDSGPLSGGGWGKAWGWTFLLVNGDSLGISGVGLPLSQAWLTPQTHGHRSGTRGAPGAPQAMQNKKCLKGVCVQFLLRLGSEFIGGGEAGRWGSTQWH